MMEATANNVAFSVQVALAQDSSPERRHEATIFCNDYLQSTSPSELCQVGFMLTRHSDPAVIRTGLQFIEHVAKFNWQTIVERDNVKENLFVIMQTGFVGATVSGQCPAFLQEALAKVIVEIAKREWPQLWPNLFPRLFEMANTSDLALLVLRRMVEDVATLQTVDCMERRRELSQSLTAIAPEVIATFFRVLIESVKEYQGTNMEIYQRRAKVCLGCLLPYIEWTNPMLFTKDNMIIVLFALLPEPAFQMEAAECILQLTERKPQRKEDRYDIPKICLGDESFTQYLRAICSTPPTPNNYDYLRKLGDILTTLASNAVVGKVKVENLLQGCEKLAMREEAISVLGSTVAINHFLKNLEKEPAGSGSATTTPESLAFASEVDKCLIRLLSLILNKFVGSSPKPSEKDEMNRLKSEFSTLLKTVGRRVPKLYNEVNTWLHNSLSSPNAIQNFQWETLTLVVDAVASSVSEDDVEVIRVGLTDLQICYSKFNSEQSIDLKSLILSLVSALFGFLCLAKKRGDFNDAHLQLMISIFDSIFKCFYYEESPKAREIRRHSAALLIKLATKYPNVMALAFDFIHSSAAASAGKLTTMEYNNVLESLMLISNVWNDFGKQSQFLGSLFLPSEWQQVSIISDSSQSLLSTFGEGVFFENKAVMMRNLSMAYSTLRKVKKINKYSVSVLQQNQIQNQNSAKTKTSTEFDPNATANGESETSAHPAYDHICPILPIILKLVKSIHSLSEYKDLTYIQELTEGEKATVVGIRGAYTQDDVASATTLDVERNKSHPELIKVFVLNMQELAYGILGDSCQVFSPRFYFIPQLGDAYLSFVGYNSQLLNDYRLRTVIRTVFKPFLISCPITQAQAVVVPFAQKFFPYMLERLVARWTIIENTKSIDAEGEEEKEVVENSALRILTKEYVDLLSPLLEKSLPTTGSGSVDRSNDVDMDNETESDGTSTIPNLTNQGSSEGSGTVGEVGLLLLADPFCFTAIVNCIVSCICWDDSNVCLRAARCILTVWEKIVPQQEVVKGTFATVLRAVCVWVESEANMDSLLKIADACFRSYCDTDPQFNQMLKDWGAPEVEIHKLVGLCRGTKNEKKRRDLFRKLVHNNPSLERNKSPKSQWLRGLPQLKVQSDGKHKVGRQSSPEIDLKECFSLIHR